MSFVLDAFQLFLQNISLPDSQLRSAQRSNNALRAFLGSDDYFGRLTLDTFLNGSYARHTAVQPIKDVDVIVVVDTDWMQADPSRAMESLRRKLAQRYTDWRTRRQRRAVKVTLSDIRLDVVLAVASDGLDRPLRIPDRELRRWVKTHPKRQMSLVKDLGARTNGNYSRLVRLFKAWARARVAAADRPSSFVLECGVFHVLTAHPDTFAGALDQAFAALVDALYSWDFGRDGFLLSWGRPSIADPAMPDTNVAERWDESAADRFRKKLGMALRRLEDIERSRWDETEVGHWRDLFGEPFPAPSTVARRIRQT
jgi:SMODS domain-containing protein